MAYDEFGEFSQHINSIYCYLSSPYGAWEKREKLIMERIFWSFYI